MSRKALFFCPECGKKAIITKTVRNHKMLYERYYSCSDSECGLTFKTTEEVKRVLSSSAKGLERLNDYLLKHGNNSQLALDMINPS